MIEEMPYHPLEMGHFTSSWRMDNSLFLEWTLDDDDVTPLVAYYASW